MKTFKWITALAFFGMMAFGVRAASRAEEHAMRKGYEHKKKNDTTALPDVRRYIRWAVQHRDYGHLCQAYKDALLFSPSPAVKLKYADSALVAAVHTRDNARIAAAHLTKGTVYYYSFRQYKNALSQYLLADKYTDRLTDRYLKYKITYHIGVVRSYLGDYGEAALQFESCIRYYRAQAKQAGNPELRYNGRKGYYNSLHQLAVCRRYMQELTKADSLVSLGLRLTAGDPDFELEEAYFHKCRGILDYYRGAYGESITSFRKAIPVLQRYDDFAWLAVVYSFMAKDLLETGSKGQALRYALKVDSVFNKKQFILPELRSNYDLLIRNAVQQKKVLAQLYYARQLLKADSTVRVDFAYLLGNIHRQYDTKWLVQDKAQLEQAYWLNTRNVIAALATAVILWLLGIWYSRREKQVGHRYKAVEHRFAPGSGSLDLQPVSRLPARKSVLTPKHNTDLQKKIEEFEKNAGFLDIKLTEKSLATKFQTNTNYLSIYINETKNMNFNSYIAMLRINYITHKMETDRSYLKFNIKALANECGYKSRQLFSDQFYRINGIRPKDYVRKRRQDQTH